LVDLISDPLARIEEQVTAIPPPCLLISEESRRVLKMPLIESSSIYIRKQDDNCGYFKPELNKVGDAWMKSFLLIISAFSLILSMVS
jgi:hypothetical protein